MARTFLMVVCCAILVCFALPAGAQMTLGTGGMITFLNDEGTVRDVGDLFAEAEYQVPVADRQWLGVNVATDGGGFAGMNLRWYYGNEDAALFPGIDLGFYRLSTAHKHVAEDTIVFGGGIVLEFNVGVGEGVLPLTLCAGYYPAVAGGDVGMGRVGLKVASNLLQERESTEDD